MLSKEIERQQMRINAKNSADCIGKLRKIVNGNGNFDLYFYPQYKYCVSYPKDGSGCQKTIYGDIKYIKKQIKNGVINPHTLTKYGRKLVERE